MTVEVNHNGVVSTISLTAPPQNLLTTDIMDALVEAHQQADAHPDTRVIVTTSGLENMFSNGLDPMYVLKKNDEDRRDIFKGVGRMLHGLYALGKPHICVVNGPAMAGGAIMAIPADFRYFDSEHGRMSFAEVKVGLPIPEALVEVIRGVVRPQYLRHVIMMAGNLDAKTALDAGLADGAASGEALNELVEKQIGRLSRLSPAVLKATKASMRRRVLEMTRSFQKGDPNFEHFVGDNFLGEGLRALVENRFANFQE